MLAGDTGLNGSFDATVMGWLTQYASDYNGPGPGSIYGTSHVRRVAVKPSDAHITTLAGAFCQIRPTCLNFSAWRGSP